MEGPNDSSVSQRESSMATKRQDQITRKAPSTVFSTTTRQINENGEKTTRVVPTTTLLPTSGIQEVSVMELKLQPEVQDDCDICLETLSSLELEYSFCGSDCPLKACKECIAKHFKDTISSGYDGILRKMTCPACVKRSVPVSLWGPVCSSNQTTLYSRRAAILLTLQCSGCHERKTILPDEDENQLLPTDGMPQAVKEELLMEFERFNDGKINDQELYERISTYFFSFENLPNPWLVMQPILQKIRDEGFRAELYLRYLRHYPKVSTICCEAEQCFRCRTEDWHDGMTCEEMRKELEAEQLSDDVLNCPECDIQLVKGDGCEWVTCVCGHGFDWEELRRASLAAAFAARRGPGGAPWAAAVIDAYPSSFAAPLVAGARAWQAAEPAAAAAGRAALWEALVGRAAAAAPLPRRGGGATLLTPLLSAAGGAAEEVVEAEGADIGGVLVPRQYPPSTRAAAMRAAAAHAAAAAAAAARPAAAAALFLPAERRLAAAWAEQAGAEIRAAREEEERAAVGAWEGLFGAGLPVTAVVRTVAPAMASRVSYYVTKTNYALCREGSSLTSAEIGTIPSGTVLAVSETYTLPCGKVRLHIIEPRRWVGWISKLDHLVMPHSQLQYSSDQSLVLSSNSFPLDLHAWVCANPESWEAAQVVSEVHKIRAWQFLYPIDPYQTAQDSASFDIFSPTLPPQHLEYLAAFTKNGRHKFLHDIRRVGNFAARHTEPLAAAYDIICRQDAYWEPDNSHEDLISAARLFCDTFRVASKKYLAQCWENKHGPYTMAVTKTLLDYEKQTKLKPKNMELMVLLADSLSKIQMKAWVSLNQAKLNAEEVQISTARQAVLKSFTTKVGFAPTPQSFTVLCLRHPKVLAPLNFLLAGSIALPENPSPLATAHGTPARNRKDAAAFQLLYGPSTVARRPAPGHMPLYRAWRALGCAPAAAAVLRLLDATPGLAAEAAALWPGRDLRYAALGRRRPVARLLQGAAAAAAAAAEQRQQEEGRRRCRPAGRRRCGGVQQTRATASGLSAAGARNRPMDPFASLVDQYNDTDFQYAVDFIPLVALSWKTNARKVDEEQGFLEELKNAYYLSRGPEGEALPKNIGILRKQHREQQLRLEELPDGCMEVAVVAPWLFPTNARALWGEVDNSSDDEGEGDSVLTLGKDNTCVTFEERHFEEQHFMSPGVPPAKQHRLTSIKDTYRNNNNSRNSHDDDEDKVNTELTKRLVESQRWRVVPVNDGGQTDCQSFRLESMKVPGQFLTFLSPITTVSVPSCPHPFDDRVVCMDPLSLTAQVHGGGEKHHALTKMKLTLLPYSWL